MTNQAKQYNVKEAEKKIAEFWQKNKIYKFSQNKKKKTYSIDTPPPYISGHMHIGHAFSYSQQDFIARFRRMKENVFYPFGTDDNGLPTEKYVEKINNIKSKSLSRHEFIELCLKTLKEMTPGFIQDYKDLGISADYDLYYSTIDKPTQKISQKSFIELYRKKFIYKQEFPTLWCPECQTTIAQAELEDKNLETLFSTLKFKSDSKDIYIATTRPELLPACVAVFINPKDKKNKSLIGKKAQVPLFNHEVPIIADTSANMEKGTGILMVCSYGDKYDAEAINRHKLIPRIVLNPDGRLNNLAGKYSGMKIKEARKAILEDLNKADLIKEQKSISHVLNVHDKCGTEIEFIATEQWFIKILDKKKQLISQGKKIKWHPEFMYKRYENWVNGLEWDWSISRDRHFGIPIPVWQCKKCKCVILPNESELPVDPLQTKKFCEKCHLPAVPEPRVLDTWATSSLTPQIASSLIGNKIKIPFSLRPQAHDIIRTWAFYTIAKSFYHENKIPWTDIMISGYVTLQGEKMSKSKGTGIQPKQVIETYGADSLRYWAAGSKLGEDMDYQEKDILTGKKFLTKIFNASNFVFMNIKNYNPEKTKIIETDRIFLAKLNKLIKDSTENFENYEYSKVKLAIDNFFWGIFCDNYLEIIKNRVYNGSKEEKSSAYYTLYHTLLTILKLISPITPFITEQIYQEHFRKNEKTISIHLADWPKPLKIQEKKTDSEILSLLLETLAKIRQEKTLHQKSMKSEIILTLEQEKIKQLQPCLEDFKSVTNAKEILPGKFNVKFL